MVEKFKKDLIREVGKKYKDGDCVGINYGDIIDDSFKVVDHYHFGIGSEIQDGSMDIYFHSGKVFVFCEDHLETNKLFEDDEDYGNQNFDDDGGMETKLENFGIGLLIYLFEEEKI